MSTHCSVDMGGAFSKDECRFPLTDMGQFIDVAFDYAKPRIRLILANEETYLTFDQVRDLVFALEMAKRHAESVHGDEDILEFDCE